MTQPTPYYADESVTLYHGDALAVLQALPSGSVDALITDPPYSSGGQFRGDRTNRTSAGKYGERDLYAEFSGDNRDQRGYAYWLALWLSECHRISHEGGLAFLFTDWRQLPTTTDALQSGGWVWRGVVPWVKPNARVFAGRVTATCEYVVWGSKGQLPNPSDGGQGHSGFYQANSPRDREHAAQKPLSVMRALVQPTPTSGVVLDPFLGSGTTGIAAVLEGRQFVGVEMDAHYVEVAKRRILTAVQGYRDDGSQMVLGAL